jgi:histidine triad (HIT) family protein
LAVGSGFVHELTDPNCVFCQIVAREISADVMYEDDATLAFRDIAPKAPVHVLVIPKAHCRDIVELSADPDTASALVTGIASAAAAAGLTEFRTIFNTGAGVGQTVFHVHAHVLGGGAIQWP